MAKPSHGQKALAIGLSAALVMITAAAVFLATMKENPYGEPPSSSDVQAVAPPDEQEDQSPSDDAASVDEPEETEPEPEPEPVSFNAPETMRAVTIAAGRDFLLAETDTARDKLAAQIDKALADAVALTMNSVILDTKYNDSVLFESSALPMAAVELDCTDYFVSKARDLGLYVYATYDVSDLAAESGGHLKASSADGHTLDEVAANIGEFAEKYNVDGILLRNYYAETGAASYADYSQNGGGSGYENYLREVPRALVSAAAGAVREKAPGTQVGLLADAVWQNQAADPDGSETTADFAALANGNADTKAMVESGMLDFVMVDNSDSTVTTEKAPFRTVCEWWSRVAGEAGVPIYTLHSNEKLGNVAGGWSVMEQLSKQLIDQEKIGGYSGSAFRSLKALNANPGGTTTVLVQYMNNQIDETYVLQQLSISKPSQLTYKTKEPAVTFQGASDPREEVTINGEKVTRNESGYFTVSIELKEGLNTFAIAHKNKTFTYNITREIIVLKDVQPTGSITVDGGMAVTISALAYGGSTVTASVGGQNITLSPSQTEGDNTDRDSSYDEYVGVFTAPSASSSATKMGTISVTATSGDGVSKTLEGASVTVNKKAQMGDGVVVQVSAEQAETFPVNTLNDSSNAGYFPLPQGTVDKTYGAEIVYKNGSNTYSYWKLESGLRVYSKDITTGGQMPDNNSISAMDVKSSGAYTTITLTTGSKIPYKVSYDGSKLVFAFEYTASVPASETFGSGNALFKSADWSGSKLTLNLKKAGGFLGYKAYYEGAGKLVLRFNNSPGALKGARIVVDPGHGGNDPGALGFYPGKDEADINLAVAQKLVSELKGRGASVLMTTPGSTMATRLASARAFNPQVLVSVHSNTNAKASAKGAEVYYFYPFQKALATGASANIADSLGTENRGAKQGLYYMTRESQFACVLAELGFISNEAEYTKMINSKYQSRMAQGIANAVSGYLGGTNSGGGTAATGVEDEEEASSEEEPAGDDDVTGVSVSKSRITIEKGESYILKATVKPATSGNRKVSWESDDTSVATVNSGGKVIAKGNGTAIITVTTDDGDYTAECEVTVKAGGSSGSTEEGITLDKDVLKLSSGQTYPLDATVNTDGSRTLRWSTGDKTIATVSSDGKVTAVGEGETWITAETKDGLYSVDCEVVVGKRDTSGGNIKSIKISGASSVAVGTRIELSAGVTPTNAQDPGVKWTSSNESIAVLSSNTDSTVKVEGVRNGTVTITAQAYDDGKAKATFKLKVGTGVGSGSTSSGSSGGSGDVGHQEGLLVGSITIDGSGTISKGTREEYTATVKPNYAEDTGVKWSVSNENILSVSYGGTNENTCKVEGLRTGTAYLIATAYDSGKATAKIKITVRS